MTKNNKAYINITKKGEDFTMDNCEWNVSSESERPLIKTDAKNTKVVRTRFKIFNKAVKNGKWFWHWWIPLAVAIIAGLCIMIVQQALF